MSLVGAPRHHLDEDVRGAHDGELGKAPAQLALDAHHLDGIADEQELLHLVVRDGRDVALARLGHHDALLVSEALVVLARRNPVLEGVGAPREVEPPPLDELNHVLRGLFAKAVMVDNGAVPVQDNAAAVGDHRARDVVLLEHGVGTCDTARRDDHERQAALFGLDAGAPAFRITRVTYDANERPFELTVTLAPGDRNSYELSSPNGLA